MRTGERSQSPNFDPISAAAAAVQSSNMKTFSRKKLEPIPQKRLNRKGIKL